jgi:hypothetical protein
MTRGERNKSLWGWQSESGIGERLNRFVIVDKSHKSRRETRTKWQRHRKKSYLELAWVRSRGDYQGLWHLVSNHWLGVDDLWTVILNWAASSEPSAGFFQCSRAFVPSVRFKLARVPLRSWISSWSWFSMSLPRAELGWPEEGREIGGSGRPGALFKG